MGTLSGEQWIHPPNTRAAKTAVKTAIITGVLCSWRALPKTTSKRIRVPSPLHILLDHGAHRVREPAAIVIVSVPSCTIIITVSWNLHHSDRDQMEEEEKKEQAATIVSAAGTSVLPCASCTAATTGTGGAVKGDCVCEAYQAAFTDVHRRPLTS